jgi:hypothetical protein
MQNWFGSYSAVWHVAVISLENELCMTQGSICKNNVSGDIELMSMPVLNIYVAQGRRPFIVYIFC